MTLLFHVQASSSVLPLPRVLDYTVELHGWGEVGAQLKAVRAGLPVPERSFVYSHRFQFASLAAFYGAPDGQVTRLGGRRDQYDVWRDEQAWRGWDAVFVCDEKFLESPDLARFRRCESAASVPITRGGRAVRTFHLWRCFGYGYGYGERPGPWVARGAS